MESNNQELYHYGVLGMKWGVRRARRKDAKRAYKARLNKATNKYHEEIASIEKPYKRGQMLSKADQDREAYVDGEYASAVVKARKQYKKDMRDKSNDAAIANRLYSKQSKDVNDRVANMSAGKALTQSFLMGSYGALKYNEARTNKSASRGKAAVEGILWNWGNNSVGGLLSAGKYLDNRFARKK